MSILNSSLVSISVNGSLHGFFNCTIGDLLSPLLFCLAEEVLSRNLGLLVNFGSMDVMKGPRNIMVPSHTFYVDVVLIFCKGSVSNIKNITTVFKEYSEVSRQFVNCGKSSIFRGAMSFSRLNIFSSLTGFCIGFDCFIYLIVPIFKGELRLNIFNRL